MEDKQLNPDQSFELIQQMIRQTRRNISSSQGNLFLWWGYLFTLTGILIFVLLKTTDCRAVQWLWMLPVIVSGIITWRHYRRSSQPVVSYTDNLLKQVWVSLISVIIVSVLMLANHHWPVSPFFTTTLLLAAGVYISGKILRNRYMQNGSGFCLPICFGFTYPTELTTADPDRNILLFAVFTAILLIGSGYALNKQVKRDAAEASKNQ